MLMARRRKVAVMGAHGCGKTSLVERIGFDFFGDYLPVMLVNEVARDCPFPLNEGMTVESQGWMLYAQMAAEECVPHGVLAICDRTVLDPIVYAMWAKSKSDWGDGCRFDSFINARIPVMLEWFGSYDLVYWARPSENMRVRSEMLSDDGFRSVDLGFQGEVDQIFEDVIKRYMLDVIPAGDYNFKQIQEVFSCETKDMVMR